MFVHIYSVLCNSSLRSASVASLCLTYFVKCFMVSLLTLLYRFLKKGNLSSCIFPSCSFILLAASVDISLVQRHRACMYFLRFFHILVVSLSKAAGKYLGFLIQLIVVPKFWIDDNIHDMKHRSRRRRLSRLKPTR